MNQSCGKLERICRPNVIAGSELCSLAGHIAAYPVRG